LTKNSPADRARILFAVLNWGLGHATRSIPIIQALKKNNQVILAATGRSLTLLRTEFPDCEWLDFPDYDVRYSRKGRFLFLYLLVQIPRILVRLLMERYRTRRLVKNRKIDIIFSDNRYGVCSKIIPSYLMTHQLRFKLPQPVRGFEFISVWFNRLMFRRFRHVFVPDIAGSENLTGKLGHPRGFSNYSKIGYIGLLSSIEKQAVAESVDVLFMISGPEPQRSVLEDLVLEQVKNIPGRRVVVLGKPGGKAPVSADRHLEIYAHLNREKMSEYVNRARLIVARAGYSTIMELVALRKRALLIPTPGQTEQEYLAFRLNELGWFRCVAQSELNLTEDLKAASQLLPPAELSSRVNDLAELLLIMELNGN